MTPIALQEVLQAFETGKRPKGGAVDQGVPSLGGEHITAEATLKLTGMKFVPTDFFDGMSKGQVQRGDVLVVKDGATTGRVGLVEPSFPFERAAVNEHLFLLRADRTRLDPQFLYFYLRSARGQAELMSDFRGAAQGGISREIGTKVRIPLPTMGDQQRIVDLLSRAEGIVRLRRQAQQKAAALIPAIFVDMFGDSVTNPKGWAVHPLGDVADVISGVAKGRQLAAEESIELPYMRVANVKDGHLDMAEVKTIRIKKTEVEKLRIVPGDLLMTEGGDPDKLGRAALWRGEIDLCVHQNHIFKVRGHQGRLVPEYLRSLAGSAYGKAYFLSVAKKTTGIASINKTQLSAFPVLLPPLAEQRKFQRQVEAVEAIAALQGAAAMKAEATFNALLARAFTAAGPQVQHEAERALA